jgi:hypothetical protein
VDLSPPLPLTLAEIKTLLIECLAAEGGLYSEDEYEGFENFAPKVRTAIEAAASIDDLFDRLRLPAPHDQHGSSWRPHFDSCCCRRHWAFRPSRCSSPSKEAASVTLRAAREVIL